MRIIVIPYRDAYFWNRYGTAVRDLQIVELLSQNHEVTVINRPVSVYERILTKKGCNSTVKEVSDRISFVDGTSYDLISPLFGRSWARFCFRKKLVNLMGRMDKFKESYIVLDFSPFAIIDVRSEYALYWHDMIDNFTKHNRFTKRERRLVKDKYLHVSSCADLVSGVTDAALDEISSPKKKLLQNGIYYEPACFFNKGKKQIAHDEFDFGFVGFITDKLDVEFLNRLAESYNVVLYGHFFDSKIKSFLDKRIFLGGGFNYSDLSNVMKSFKVGLLPYLKDRCHDESPLKLYEYFKNGKPCLASINYEIESEYFINYSCLNSDELMIELSRILNLSCGDEVTAEVQDSWSLESRLSGLIENSFAVV